MSRGFFGLCWMSANAAAAERARSRALRLDRDPAWRRTWTSDGVFLWARGEGLPLTMLPAERGIIIGQAWPVLRGAGTAQAETAFAQARSAAEVAWIVSQSFWGRFLAILFDGEGAGSLYRDPSGMVEGLTWTLEAGVQAVTSDLVLAPRDLRPRRQALNWDRIATFLAAPAAATTFPLFDDVTAVGPGEFLELGARGASPTVVWDPAAFAARPITDLAEAQREIVRRVDVSTSALADSHGPALVELSGGLDSSIVAGALEATIAKSRVAAWVNFADTRAESDERRYATAVADRLGASLRVQPLIPAVLEEADFAEVGRYTKPSIGGADAGRDRAELALLREFEAKAIISGQGGDGVFFQFPSALVAADAFRRDGCRTLISPLLADVARRSRRSVWSVLGQVRAARSGKAVLPVSLSTVASREVLAFAAKAEHAWVRLGRDRDLPPGKLLHLHGAAVTHIYRGPSRRLEEAELLLPLFTQPVLELCLAIAVPDLAGGSFDRPFARSAFAGRLPQAVLQRRTKGALGAYFARTVTASLSALRPYLLDGCLADAGVIDRERLDRALDPAQLLWGGSVAPADVLIAAAIEAWVRHWQTQVGDSPCAGR